MDKAGVSRLFRSLKLVRRRKGKIGAILLLGLFALMFLGSMSVPISGNEISYMLRPINDSTLSDEAEIGSVVLTERGTEVYLGGNQWSYFTQMGLSNTWNGTHWVRWIYNQTTKSIRIRNVTISHNQDGTITISGESGIKIGYMKWYSQYYFNDEWRNVTLDNYQWLGFEVTSSYGIAKQRFWGSQGELVVSYMYRNNEEFKITVDVTNNGVQDVPVRIIWVAHDLQDVAGNYEIIKQEIFGKNVTVGIMIDDLRISWMDARTSDPNIAINTVLDKPNRRAAVVFGNQSSVLPAGHTYTLDPSVNPVMGADSDDDYWNFDQPSGPWTHYPNALTINLREPHSNFWYIGGVRFVINIVSGATITSATLSLYEDTDSGDNDANVYRISEDNVGSLEADTVFPIDDYSEYASWDFDGVEDEWGSATVTDLVQTQVDLGGWSTGQYMGFHINQTDLGAGTHFKFEDYQNAGTNHAYMNITYTTGGTPYEKNLTEPVDAADVQTNAADYDRSYTETVSAADVRTIAANMVRNLVESIGVVGVLTMIRGREKDLVETITVADVRTFSIDYARNLVESVTVSDVWSKTFGLNRSESISAIDAQSNAAVYVRDFVEAITVVETIEASKAIQKIMFEAITASDVRTTAADYVRNQTESISAIDAQSNAAVYVRDFVEAITAADVQTNAADFARDLVESINVVDLIDTEKGAGIHYERDLTESITVYTWTTWDTHGGTWVGASMIYQLFYSDNMWSYLGPIAFVIGGYFVSKRDVYLGIIWFIVICLIVSQYLTLVSATMDYWWHIFILLIGGMLTCVYPLWGKR